jgi:N-methylhydantoinase A
VERFHVEHARSYGYADRERVVEIVTLRVQAVARTRRPQRKAAAVRKGDAQKAVIATHRIFEDGQWREGVLYDRQRLRPGDRFAGPAVVVELSATTYLPGGWTAAVDGFHNLILSPRRTRAGKRAQPKERR